MPDLGKEYHPLHVRRMGWLMLVLFVAGLVIYIIAMINLDLDLVLLGMGVIFFCPFIIMALSSLTVGVHSQILGTFPVELIVGRTPSIPLKSA